MTISFFIVSFIVSAIISFIFIRLGIKGYFIDDAQGVQKHHHKKTPRIGGVAIFSGILCAGALLLGEGEERGKFWFCLLGALPVFCGGVFEDYTKKASPLLRLLLALVSTSLVFFILDVQLRSVSIYPLDLALSFTVVSFLFTLFAVSGLANSINIIDGYNGLAGVVSLLILFSLSYLSLKLHDFFLLQLCILSIGAVAGFLIWNYPHGLIFLGDSGAYLIGFLIATISIMLVNRNPEVSPWFPLLLCIYPVWETVFSMFRRKVLQKKAMMSADALHLHSLIYKRVLQDFSLGINAEQSTMRNSLTSLYLWILCLLSVVPALVFWYHTIALCFFSLAFILIYLWLYRRIIRFETPRFMVVGGGKK